MPDMDLQETGKTGGRDKRGRFEKGCSGNPTGRPKGIPNPATRAAMLLDAEAEALVRKAIESAPAGDSVAMRLCLDRDHWAAPRPADRTRPAADRPYG